MGVITDPDYRREYRREHVHNLDELASLQARIRQLEDLNAKLAAEVDAMRPVVEAVQVGVKDGAIGTGYGPHLRNVYEAVRGYEERKLK